MILLAFYFEKSLIQNLNNPFTFFPMRIINGKEIAREIEEKIKEKVEKEKIKPGLATLLIGKNEGSLMYMRLKERACQRIGFHSKRLDFSSDVSEKKIIENIKSLNEDEKIHGILIQFPLPSHLNPSRLINEIDYRKDVDGIHSINMGRLLIGDEFLIPCTPLAVTKILEWEGINVKGMEIVIINHSNIVGKPLAAMLLNRNATVTVCHIHSKDVKIHSRNADILITGTGVRGLIKEEHIKEGSIIIDVGISRSSNGSVCGDVEIGSVKSKARAITPVPGGVGPVTVASLMENTFKAFESQKS